MKNLSVFIFVAGLLFSTHASATNLILNGDFENSAGWSAVKRQSDLTWEYAAGQGIDASIALKASATDIGGENNFYVLINNTLFHITQNTSIKVTFWARAFPVEPGAEVSLTPFVQETDGNSFTNFDKTTLTTTWTKYELTSEITSSTSDNYRFRFRVPSVGDIYIDNVTVELVEVSTALNTLEGSNVASIYPNPTSNILNINSNSSSTNYSIFNLLGSKVLHGSGQQLDVSALEAGVYMLTLEDGSQFKFIKK